jgi:PPOX class probable F420-dependent enzyme
MSRRREIVMSPDEIQAFLAEERIVTCATIGPNGRPHLMPLWYVVRDGLIHAWTYGTSQKVKNLERLPQATLQVEAGNDRYGELRGVMMECDVDLVDGGEEWFAVGADLAYRYGAASPADPPDVVRAGVEKRGRKRVVLRFRPTRIVSWDHRKLGGGGY